MSMSRQLPLTRGVKSRVTEETRLPSSSRSLDSFGAILVDESLHTPLHTFLSWNASQQQQQQHACARQEHTLLCVTISNFIFFWQKDLLI